MLHRLWELSDKSERVARVGASLVRLEPRSGSPPADATGPHDDRTWSDHFNGAPWRNSVTRVPPRHLRRSKRRSPSTIPPHTPWTPKSDPWRREYSRHSARTGHATQTAIASAASSRANTTSLATGNHRSGSMRELTHRPYRYTRLARLLSLSSPGRYRTG